MFNIYRLYYLVIKTKWEEVERIKDKSTRRWVGMNTAILTLLIIYRVYCNIFNDGVINEKVLIFGIALIGLEGLIFGLLQAGIAVQRIGVKKSTQNVVMIILKTFLYVLLPCFIITLMIIIFAPR